MIRTALTAVACFGLFSIQACSQQPEPGATMDPKNPKDKISYSIGASIGKNLKDQKAEITPEIL